MFNRGCKYIISRDNRDYIYEFTTSKNIKYEVKFMYESPGVCNFEFKNLTEDRYDVVNYKNNTSIEFYSTLINILDDFMNLVLPDVVISSYSKNDPISRYKLNKRLHEYIIKKYKNVPHFNKITYEEEDLPNKVIFYAKRNSTNNLLQLKRKRLNRG